jgi:hypothetical protein
LDFNWTTSCGLALLSILGLIAKISHLVPARLMPKVLKSLWVLAAITGVLAF